MRVTDLARQTDTTAEPFATTDLGLLTPRRDRNGYRQRRRPVRLRFALKRSGLHARRRA